MTIFTEDELINFILEIRDANRGEFWILMEDVLDEMKKTMEKRRDGI